MLPPFSTISRILDLPPLETDPDGPIPAGQEMVLHLPKLHRHKIVECRNLVNALISSLWRPQSNMFGLKFVERRPRWSPPFKALNEILNLIGANKNRREIQPQVEGGDSRSSHILSTGSGLRYLRCGPRTKDRAEDKGLIFFSERGHWKVRATARWRPHHHTSHSWHPTH